MKEQYLFRQFKVAIVKVTTFGLASFKSESSKTDDQRSLIAGRNVWSEESQIMLVT